MMSRSSISGMTVAALGVVAVCQRRYRGLCYG